MAVRIEGLVRRFADRAGEPVEVLLAGIDLDVLAGQFVALLGPSGCGKSTLLRLVAGLDAADGGSLVVGRRPIRRREHPEAMAFVFQEAHLLPWRTLVRNVQLPLELRGAPRAESRDRALDMLERVGLLDVPLAATTSSRGRSRRCRSASQLPSAWLCAASGEDGLPPSTRLRVRQG